MFDCPQLQVRRAMAAALPYCAILAAFCLPSSAHATPADVIHIADTPIAANEEAIFVERRTADNMGLHHELRVEMFLVSINIDSGKETIWPIYGTHQTTDFDENTNAERNVVLVDPSERWHNPYTILAKAKAFPLRSFVDTRITEPPKAKRGEGADEDKISITYPDDYTFSFSRDAAIARLNRSVAALAKEVVNANRLSSQPTRLLYSDREAEPQSCSFAAEDWPIRFETNAVQMVRITCGGIDETEATSLVFPVRSARNTAPAS